MGGREEVAQEVQTVLLMLCCEEEQSSGTGALRTGSQKVCVYIHMRVHVCVRRNNSMCVG